MSISWWLHVAKKLNLIDITENFDQDECLYFFHLFSSFQTQNIILQQINVKNFHPVYGAGIRTHDLWNMSLLP